MVRIWQGSWKPGDRAIVREVDSGDRCEQLQSVTNIHHSAPKYGVAAVLVTPLPGSQEIGSAGSAEPVPSHVANVPAVVRIAAPAFKKPPLADAEGGVHMGV